jgi:hypothetical protein
MASQDLYHFKKLKLLVGRRACQNYPTMPDKTSDWKGKDIQLFQEDLQKTVQGRVSEKWFYTHLKSEADKLPRIDVLDMLSKYVGFEDWRAFRRSAGKRRKRIRILIAGVIVLLALPGMIYFLASIERSHRYIFKVVDAYTQKPLDAENLVVMQLFEDQSPMVLTTSVDSAFHIVGFKKAITIAISAPYYFSDTLVRLPSKNHFDETVHLWPNNYALMLHYFSTTDSENWTQHRTQLSEIIADDALILQVSSTGEIPLEMYNKQLFINKLTIPTKGLRNIEIIDMHFKNNEISYVRFIQKEGDNDE